MAFAGVDLPASIKALKPKASVLISLERLSLAFFSALITQDHKVTFLLETSPRKLSWRPTLITSDRLSVTIPATHKEGPGGRLATPTCRTPSGEPDKLLSYLEVYSHPYSFIPGHRLLEAMREKDDPDSFLPSSYHLGPLTPFSGRHSTQLCGLYFLLYHMNNNDKNTFSYFPVKKICFFGRQLTS